MSGRQGGLGVAGAFTLVELLVVLALLSVLGGGLVLMLRQGVRVWRTGDARRVAYEEAKTVLGTLADDLAQLFSHGPDVAGGAGSARMIVDLDPRGRQRLVFVRTLPDAGAGALTELAGVRLGADAYLDRVDDRAEALAGRLLPTGGLMEVAYAMAPGGEPVLLRGERSPPGGTKSLFSARVLDDAAELERVCSPLSVRVLHFDILLWGPSTTAWEEQGEGRPARLWDSTRGALPADVGEEAGFVWARGERSRLDPRDDLFPERVRIELVIEEDPPAGRWASLTQPLGAEGDSIHVDDSERLGRGVRWLRVGEEWVRVRFERAGRFRVEPGGRGLRGTEAKAHPAGTLVQTGRRFVLEVALPTVREAWGR